MNIAAGHKDGYVSVWNVDKTTLVKELKAHSDEVRSLAYSVDGKYLASGGFDGKIFIHDVRNDYSIVKELKHKNKVVSIRWHPEIPMLISTSADNTALVWMED